MRTAGDDFFQLAVESADLLLAGGEVVGLCQENGDQECLADEAHFHV